MLGVGDSVRRHSGESGGGMWFWDVAAESAKYYLAEHDGSVTDVAWSPDGKFAATASRDSTACLINVDTGEVQYKLKPDKTQGSARPDWTHDGKLMAYSCRDKTIRVWDVDKCKHVSLLSVPSNVQYPTVIRWSPDAKKIAVLAYSDQSVRILDVKSGVVTAVLREKTYSLNDVVWTNDSAKVIVSESRYGDSGTTGRILVWDVAGSKLAFTLKHKKPTSNHSLAMSPDGKKLASVSSRGYVHLWDLAAQKKLRTIKADEQYVRNITFSPDGKMLASCGRAETVKLWAVETGKPLQNFRKHESEVYRVDFSPDSKRLVSCGMNGYIAVWDIKEGKNVAWFRGPNWHVRWMKDSKTIAAASGSGVYFYGTAPVARKAIYTPMPNGQGVLISSNGHYSGTPGSEKSLIYQAVKLSGQSTLTPEEFGKRFGWKNDPSKIKLIETTDKALK